MNFAPFSLTGKTILVTGASSGIGRQVAITCSQHGAVAVITGRNKQRLEQTLQSLAGTGHRLYTADLTSADELRALCESVGPIDGMFFSAGVAGISPFRMISEKHLRSIMSIDFEAPVLLTQRLLQGRLIRPGASIVFNTAGAADTAPAATAIYAGAKAGLKAASRSLALEASRHDIRVTCLQLGYVQTEMLGTLAQGGMAPNELADGAPLGMGTVEDAAYAALFLLSAASRGVSRASLIVDGGGSLRISH